MLTPAPTATRLVSYGEIAPDFGNRGALRATQDSTPLARPRLVVPGDVKGGRYVSDAPSDPEARPPRVG